MFGRGLKQGFFIEIHIHVLAGIGNEAEKMRLSIFLISVALCSNYAIIATNTHFYCSTICHLHYHLPGPSGAVENRGLRPRFSITL